MHQGSRWLVLPGLPILPTWDGQALWLHDQGGVERCRVLQCPACISRSPQMARFIAVAAAEASGAFALQD